MTDSNRSLNEVPGLIEERRRYEGWIAALDARRDSTPKHVFDRVRTDYLTRLQRVAEVLASHRHAIEEERASVQSRLSLLEAEERLHRDERAELELRAHVGELVGDEAEAAFRTVDEKIGHIVSEKDSLQNRIAELQQLLDEGAPTPPPSEPVPAEPIAQPESQPQAAAEEPAVVAREEEENDLPATVERSVQHMATTSNADKPESGHDGGSAPAGRPASAPSGVPETVPPSAPRRGLSGPFDELAFLSSIVGKEQSKAAGQANAAPKPAMAPPQNATAAAPPLIERRSSEPLLQASDNIDRDEPPTESLLAGIEKAKRATGDIPLAANVSANTPIVLRPTGTIEQSKTLKCNECGAMNYPTEWYCERCGAELAAL